MARRDVKASVRAAARSVFSKKGYREATVADILEEAGIARATFYNYFPNKRKVFSDLIWGFVRTLYENISMYILEGPFTGEALTERVRQSLVATYGFLLENRGILQVYYREAIGSDPGLYAAWDDFDRRMESLFIQMLDRGAREGVLRDVDRTLVARALLVIFFQVPYREIMAEGRTDIDIESMAGELVAMAMGGLLVGPEGGEGPRLSEYQG